MRRKEPLTITCVRCGADALAWSAKRKYCSPSCQNAAARRLTPRPRATCHPEKPRATKDGHCGACWETFKYQNDPEYRAQILERQRAYGQNPAYKRTVRNRNLIKSYGITLEQYEGMLEAQGGVCAICGGSDSTKELSVDHCHATGKVRGLLCFHCNSALGKFGDDPERIRRAADYVEGI